MRPPPLLALLLLLAAARRSEQFGRLSDLWRREGSVPAVASADAALCSDSDRSCKGWAEASECKKNQEFMHATCPKSCGVCDRGRQAPPAVKPAARNLVTKGRRGCVDEEGLDCKERAERGECYESRGDVALRCVASCRLCRFSELLHESFSCDDTHANCVTWAAAGECEKNKGFMHSSCASACDLCDEKRHVCDRPADTPPVVRPGDINATMTRILTEPRFAQYRPRKISYPGGPKGPLAPWVLGFENFVSDEEARAFTDNCEKHFDRSLAGDQLSPVRTSYQCWCSQNECERSNLTAAVAARISDVVRAPVRYMEPFQVVRYEPGQFYRVHHDQNSGHFTPQGARVYTFFMYLNTPEEGGGTRFHNLGVTVPAIKGHAVLWPSVMDSDPYRDEPMTNHEATPVVRGMKYASNVWVHNYDYRTPSSRNCLLTHKNTH